MGKWKIPRHQPRKISEDIRGDINHGKRFTRQKLARMRKETARKIEEFRRYQELANTGIEAATFVLGSCNRKKSLPFVVAKRCAISAWLETGKVMYVYACPYCGKHHITSHPEPGKKYAYCTKDFKMRSGL